MKHAATEKMLHWRAAPLLVALAMGAWGCVAPAAPPHEPSAVSLDAPAVLLPPPSCAEAAGALAAGRPGTCPSAAEGNLLHDYLHPLAPEPTVHADIFDRAFRPERNGELRPVWPSPVSPQRCGFRLVNRVSVMVCAGA